VWRRVTLAAVAALGVAALGSVVSGALAQVSFEPTEAARFQGWAARPLLDAGVAALACDTAGLVGWFVARRRPRVLAGAALATVAATGILGWGLAARAGRSHPEQARAEALASLVMPAGYTPTGTSIDHPDAVTAPAATRTWTAPAGGSPCGDLRDGLVRWADPATVRGAAGNTIAGRCYWSAAWHHHPVDANVVPGPGGGVVVSVRLAG